MPQAGGSSTDDLFTTIIRNPENLRALSDRGLQDLLKLVELRRQEVTPFDVTDPHQSRRFSELTPALQPDAVIDPPGAGQPPETASSSPIAAGSAPAALPQAPLPLDEAQDVVTPLVTDTLAVQGSPAAGMMQALRAAVPFLGEMASGAGQAEVEKRASQSRFIDEAFPDNALTSFVEGVMNSISTLPTPLTLLKNHMLDSVVARYDEIRPEVQSGAMTVDEARAQLQEATMEAAQDAPRYVADVGLFTGELMGSGLHQVGRVAEAAVNTPLEAVHDAIPQGITPQSSFGPLGVPRTVDDMVVVGPQAVQEDPESPPGFEGVDLTPEVLERATERVVERFQDDPVDATVKLIDVATVAVPILKAGSIAATRLGVNGALMVSEAIKVGGRGNLATMLEQSNQIFRGSVRLRPAGVGPDELRSRISDTLVNFNSAEEVRRSLQMQLMNRTRVRASTLPPYRAAPSDELNTAINNIARAASHPLFDESFALRTGAFADPMHLPGVVAATSVRINAPLLTQAEEMIVTGNQTTELMLRNVSDFGLSPYFMDAGETGIVGGAKVAPMKETFIRLKPQHQVPIEGFAVDAREGIITIPDNLPPPLMAERIAQAKAVYQFRSQTLPEVGDKVAAATVNRQGPLASPEMTDNKMIWDVYNELIQHPESRSGMGAHRGRLPSRDARTKTPTLAPGDESIVEGRLLTEAQSPEDLPPAVVGPNVRRDIPGRPGDPIDAVNLGLEDLTERETAEMAERVARGELSAGDFLSEVAERRGKVKPLLAPHSAAEDIRPARPRPIIPSGEPPTIGQRVSRTGTHNIQSTAWRQGQQLMQAVSRMSPKEFADFFADDFLSVAVGGTKGATGGAAGRPVNLFNLMNREDPQIRQTALQVYSEIDRVINSPLSDAAMTERSWVAYQKRQILQEAYDRGLSDTLGNTVNNIPVVKQQGEAALRTRLNTLFESTDTSRDEIRAIIRAVTGENTTSLDDIDQVRAVLAEMERRVGGYTPLAMTPEEAVEAGLIRSVDEVRLPGDVTPPKSAPGSDAAPGAARAGSQKPSAPRPAPPPDPRGRFVKKDDMVPPGGATSADINYTDLSDANRGAFWRNAILGWDANVPSLSKPLSHANRRYLNSLEAVGETMERLFHNIPVDSPDQRLLFQVLDGKVEGSTLDALKVYDDWASGRLSGTPQWIESLSPFARKQMFDDGGILEIRSLLKSVHDELKVLYPNMGAFDDYMPYIRNYKERVKALYAQTNAVSVAEGGPIIEFSESRWARGAYIPAELVPVMPRKTLNPFVLSRESALPPDVMNAAESLQLYLTMAFRDIHMGPEFNRAASIIRQSELIRASPWASKKVAAAAIEDAALPDQMRKQAKTVVKAFERLESAGHAQPLPGWAGTASRVALNRFKGVPSVADHVFDDLMFNTVGRIPGINLDPRPSARMALRITNAFYVGILGMNPGPALKNVTQNINSITAKGAEFSSRHAGTPLAAAGPVVGLAKWAKAAAVFNRPVGRSVMTPQAGWRVMPGWQDAYAQKLTHSFTGLYEREFTATAALRSRLARRTPVGRSLRRVVSTRSGFMFMQSTEFFNRGIAATIQMSDDGVYRQARDLGASITDDQLVRALDFSDNVQFIYDQAAKPAFTAGPLAQTGWMLYTFPRKQAEFIIKAMSGQSAQYGPAAFLYNYLTVNGMMQYWLREIGVYMPGVIAQDLEGTPLAGEGDSTPANWYKTAMAVALGPAEFLPNFTNIQETVAGAPPFSAALSVGSFLGQAWKYSQDSTDAERYMESLSKATDEVSNAFHIGPFGSLFIKKSLQLANQQGDPVLRSNTGIEAPDFLLREEDRPLPATLDFPLAGEAARFARDRDFNIPGMEPRVGIPITDDATRNVAGFEVKESMLRFLGVQSSERREFSDARRTLAIEGANADFAAATVTDATREMQFRIQRIEQAVEREGRGLMSRFVTDREDPLHTNEGLRADLEQLWEATQDTGLDMSDIRRKLADGMVDALTRQFRATSHDGRMRAYQRWLEESPTLVREIERLYPGFFSEEMQEAVRKAGDGGG